MANFLKSIFNFKTKSAETFNKDSLAVLADFIKATIINRIGTELSNAEKKVAVDNAVTNFVRNSFKSDNVFVQFLIEKLIEAVPLITQIVYDFLKDRIEGLTKKEVA